MQKKIILSGFSSHPHPIPFTTGYKVQIALTNTKQKRIVGLYLNPIEAVVVFYSMKVTIL